MFFTLGYLRFLRHYTNSTTIKEKKKQKLDKLFFIKLKAFYSSKHKPYFPKRKGKPNLKKISATHIHDKGLVPRIYKELLQSNNKKTNNPIKMGKRLKYFRIYMNGQ